MYYARACIEARGARKLLYRKLLSQRIGRCQAALNFSKGREECNDFRQCRKSTEDTDM